MALIAHGDCDNCTSTDVALWLEPDSDRYICDDCIDDLRRLLVAWASPTLLRILVPVRGDC